MMNVIMMGNRRTEFFRFSGILVFTAGLMLSSILPVQAQDIQPLLDRIDRLERDIRALNIYIAKGASGTPPELSVVKEDIQTPSGAVMSTAAVARIDARIGALENDVRVATGAMEEIDHRIFQISSQLDKVVSDIEFRLSTLEQSATSSSLAFSGNNAGATLPGTTPGTTPTGELAINTAPTVGNVSVAISQSSEGILGSITQSQLQQITDQAAALQAGQQGGKSIGQSQQTALTPQEQTDVPSVPQVPQVQTQAATQSASVNVGSAATAQEDYTNAFGLLRQAKYEEAASALQQFIDKHGDDPLAVNARYWLGETYYVRSQFVKAAEVFFEGYRANPTGAKAPDTLLKLGMSLSNLGKKPEACAAFAKLASEFSNASASVRTTMQREQIRNECG